MGRITQLLPKLETALKDFEKVAPDISKAINKTREAVSKRHDVLVRLENLTSAIKEATARKKPQDAKNFQEASLCLGKLKVLDQNVITCVAAMNIELEKAGKIQTQLQGSDIEKLIAEKRKKATSTERDKAKVKKLEQLEAAYGKIVAHMHYIGEDQKGLNRFMESSSDFDTRPEVPPRLLQSTPQQLAKTFVPEEESPYPY